MRPARRRQDTTAGKHVQTSQWRHIKTRVEQTASSSEEIHVNHRSTRTPWHWREEREKAWEIGEVGRTWPDKPGVSTRGQHGSSRLSNTVSYMFEVMLSPHRASRKLLIQQQSTQRAFLP
jgi:hypothetical protein